MKRKIVFITVGAVAIIFLCIALGFVFIEVDKSTYSGDKEVKVISKFTAQNAEKNLSKEENMCYSPISEFLSMALISESMDTEQAEEIYDTLGVKNRGKLFEVCRELCDDILCKDERDNYISEVKLSVWDENEVCEMTDNYFSERLLKGVIDNSRKEDSEKGISSNVEFEGLWDLYFSESKINKFTLETGQSIETQFITGKRYARCMSGNGYTATGIYYIGGNELILIIPDDDKKIKDILNESVLNEVMAIYSSNKKRYAKEFDVTFTIPLFEISEKTAAENINSVQVTQNMKFGIDQFGTFAENVEGLPRGSVVLHYEKRPEAKEITVDRPFIYILVNNDVPLMIGTVYNPAE